MTLSIINKLLGPDAAPHVLSFIENNKDYLGKNISQIQVNTIANYVYLIEMGDYSKLTNITANELFDLYDDYILNYKNNYTTKSYVENNKIILDNRNNGIGFYWVDLEKEFCIESMIRMEDCGRVNYGNTTLELREYDDNLNKSHMIVVYENKTGNIKQVKGKRNSKPPKKYWSHFYNLLMNTTYKINRYVPAYKPENDLLVKDLPLVQQQSIYEKHPNLNKIKQII